MVDLNVFEQTTWEKTTFPCSACIVLKITFWRITDDGVRKTQRKLKFPLRVLVVTFLEHKQERNFFLGWKQQKGRVYQERKGLDSAINCMSLIQIGLPSLSFDKFSCFLTGMKNWVRWVKSEWDLFLFVTKRIQTNRYLV